MTRDAGAGGVEPTLGRDRWDAPGDSMQLVGSTSFFLPSEGNPNLRSREAPLALGGGGKDWPLEDSGEGRWTVGSGALARDMLAV